MAGGTCAIPIAIWLTTSASVTASRASDAVKCVVTRSPGGSDGRSPHSLGMRA